MSARMDGMDKVQIQDTANSSIEVHFASLNAASEECTWIDLKNLTCHTKTVRVDQTSNANTVANFHCSHGSPSPQISSRQTEIMR
jgi:hypothetical protein